MNDIQSVVEQLEWSDSRRGRVASPNAAFWSLWRADKEAVRAAGYSCRPASGGGWEVCERAANRLVNQAPVSSASAAEQVPPPVIHDGRRAALVPDFQPAALDSSRKWSDEQLAIFDWFKSGSGNLVVQARAGTGKTTTIKAAFSQAPEAEILYAVFNKKNQLEAQNSISDPRVEIKTLHAVGYKLIRMVWNNAKPDDSVEDVRVNQVLGRQADNDEVAGAIRKLVGFAKNTFVWPSIEELIQLAEDRDIDVSEIPGWSQHRLAQAAFKVLELSKERDSQGRISFNDMVWLPVAAGWVRPLFDLVCVDETQDMNLLQLLMVIGLVRPGGRIAVVGDDRQAIYAFRGAAQDGMKLMQDKLQAKVLGLTITYRCPKSVVALAAEIVPDYRAADAAPEGEVRNMGDGILLESLQIGDAVLSRANAPLLPLCLKLLRKGVSARIEGRDIGKTLASLVKKMNAKSVPHFIERVNTWADKQRARAKGSKNFEARCETINDQAACLIAVAEGVSGVSEIEPRLLSLFQDTNGYSKPAVVLSSVHKAKGLEWERVYLLSKTFRPNAIGEEANIYYVAITRSKKELVMVYEDKPKDN